MYFFFLNASVLKNKGVGNTYLSSPHSLFKLDYSEQLFPNQSFADSGTQE
jgi:hypothetical protein